MDEIRQNRNIRKVRRDIYEVVGSGGTLYMAEFKKNTGTHGGYVIVTDSGKCLHVPQGKVGEVVDAIEKASYKKLEEQHGTVRVIGEDVGVKIRDVDGDEEKISDNEARRIADSAKEYALREAAAKEAMRRL